MEDRELVDRVLGKEPFEPKDLPFGHLRACVKQTLRANRIVREVWDSRVAVEAWWPDARSFYIAVEEALSQEAVALIDAYPPPSALKPS